MYTSFCNVLDPTPRWRSLKEAHQSRAYSSLPRGKSATHYPSLLIHKTNAANPKPNDEVVETPFRRAKSVDVSNDLKPITEKPQPMSDGKKTISNDKPRPSIRENPLIKYCDNERRKSKCQKIKRQSSNAGDGLTKVTDTTETIVKGINRF